MTKKRGLAKVAVCLFFTLFSGALQAAPEYRIKAAFLYNLARMVEWPNENILTAKKPFVICFIGEEPFGDALDLIDDKQVRNRDIEFHKEVAVGQAEHCAMLFISASEDERLEEILGEIRTSPILTVADTPGFAERGVIVNLLREEKKVKLWINTQAAKLASLELSPTLIELATLVKPREPLSVTPTPETIPATGGEVPDPLAPPGTGTDHQGD